MLEDAELLRRYAEEKSELAFAELVQRRLGLVYAVALRQCGGDAHLAEDVAQRVFADLARKASQLSRRPVLSGWLCRSAQFAASDVVRAERRRRAREQATSTMHEPSPDPIVAADWEKLRPMLDQAMNELADDDRDALALRFFEERDFAGIGQILQITGEAARKRVTRALDRLRAQLARRGVTSTSAALALVLANQSGVAAPAGLAVTVASAALAAPAAGGVLAVFMGMTKLQIGIVALVGLVGLGTAGFQLNALRAAKLARVAAEQKSTALRARTRDVVQQVATTERAVLELKGELEAERVRRAATAERARIAATWNPDEAGKAFLRRHPEIAPAMIARTNADWNGRLLPLYKSLGLSRAQIEELLSLHRAMQRRGATATIDGNKAKLSVDEDAPLSGTEFSLRLRALLGEHGVAEWRKINVESYQYPLALAREVASNLCFAESPLTPAQGESLFQMLHAANIANGGIKATKPVEIDWVAIDAQVRRILLPQQMVAWETVSTKAKSEQALALAKAARQGASPK